MSKERPPEPLDFFIWTVEVYFSFTLFLFNSLDFIGSCVRSCHYSHNCDHCSDIIIIILTASNFSDFDRDGNLWLWWLIVQVFFIFHLYFLMRLGCGLWKMKLVFDFFFPGGVSQLEQQVYHLLSFNFFLLWKWIKKERLISQIYNYELAMNLRHLSLYQSVMCKCNSQGFYARILLHSDIKWLWFSIVSWVSFNSPFPTNLTN
jgi:hypothetical protein